MYIGYMFEVYQKNIICTGGLVLLDYRKLIKFGGSSHIISLPNGWLKKNNLNKGDLVYLNENGNNELVLSSEIKEEKKELKEVTLNVDKKFLDIRREIVSNYVGGCDIIKIVGNNLEEISKDVREVIRNLTSFEIVEHTSKSMVAKNFLDIKEISIENLIRRIDIITRSMIEDSKNSIRGGNRYELLKDKDCDVNRLSFLALRTIRLSLSDFKIAKILKMDNLQLLSNWMLVSYLEKVADETKRIARFLSMARLNENEAKDLEKIYSSVEKEYFNAMKSYYSEDKELAFSVASNKDNLLNMCNEYFKKYNKGVIGGIVEKMKGMVVHIRNIGRTLYFN